LKLIFDKLIQKLHPKKNIFHKISSRSSTEKGVISQEQRSSSKNEEKLINTEELHRNRKVFLQL